MSLVTDWQDREKARQEAIKKKRVKHARRLSKQQRKLTPARVRKVHRLRNEGRSIREIASAVGVSIRTVQNILDGRHYKDVQRHVGERK